MESKRQQKINTLILRELSDIMHKEIKPVGGIMITITKVSVTTDLSYARVRLSIFGTDKKKDVVAEVNKMSRELRYLLGERVRHQLRIIPELQFFEDDSLDYIENITNLLNGEKHD